MAIKRINLCFNNINKQHKDVYNVIQNKKHKTEFVIEAVLFFLNASNNMGVDKETIKDAIREVLSEYSIEEIRDKKDCKDKVGEEIPDEVFDMFNSL